MYSMCPKALLDLIRLRAHNNSMDNEKYLLPGPAVLSDHPDMIDLAGNIVAGAESDADQAVLLFNLVRDSIRYNPYVPFWDISHYTAPATLKRGKGYCVQKSILLVTLARAAGIPARLGFGDITNHLLPDGLKDYLGSNIMTYHCWAELYMSGRWCKATPSFELPLCEKMGWRLVEFDGRSNALLPETDLAGRKHVSYDRFHFTSETVPLDVIIPAWKGVYGAERVDRWRKELARIFPDEAG